MPGFVNGLSFTADGKHLLAAVGQAHRLGNWTKIKEARNSLAIIPLKIKEDKEDEEENGGGESESEVD